MKFFEHLKNIFIILIFLQIAPSLFESIRKQYGKYILPTTKFAIIEAKGILYNSNQINKQLKKSFENEDIKAILIKMECPGAASGTSHAIFNEIMTLKKEFPEKPIVTLVENICTSGGYYIACATDSIVAPACSLIGSIGATLPYLFQLKEFMEEYKIKYESITAGKYKNATDPFVQITEQDRQMLQNVIDDSYDQFSKDVIKTRKLSINNKNEWADGKIFTGKQALSLGLVDSIGSASDAVAILKEKALVAKEKEIEWVKYGKESTFWRLFFTGSDNDKNDSMFSTFANKICNTFENRYLTKRIF